MNNEELVYLWESMGFECVNTGGTSWAQIKVLRGIEFWVTDYEETRYPEPTEQLIVGAYWPNSGEFLNFTETANNLQEVETKLLGWTEIVLSANSHEAKPGTSPGAPRPGR
jgi:hypothetical protein